MLTNDYRETTELPADSPLRKAPAPPLASRSAGTTSCAACSRVGWERPHTVGPDELALLETFTELAGAACRNASAHAGLARVAQTDSLTGCLNHAALHERPASRDRAAPRATPSTRPRSC